MLTLLSSNPLAFLIFAIGLVVAITIHEFAHAKNRTKHAFKHNLHRATIEIEGVKRKVLVPTKVLRQLKAEGLTTHFKKAE